MTYQGIGFNSKSAATKTVEQFVKEQSHQGLTVEQLKEAHALCVKKEKPEVIKSDQDKK